MNKKSKNKKTILIVEDEISTREALADKVREEGFLILEAGDGEEGLKMAESKKPDLILLDIVMPGMDGIAMLKKMREEEWGNNISVLLLTNLSNDEKLLESKDLGSVGYLVKSDWSIFDVVKKINEIIKK